MSTANESTELPPGIQKSELESEDPWVTAQGKMIGTGVLRIVGETDIPSEKYCTCKNSRIVLTIDQPPENRRMFTRFKLLLTR